MDLVTSLPLPPDYWTSLSVDEIEKMTPPSADLFDSSSLPFGYPSEPIPTDLHHDDLNDMFSGLTGNMKESMELFMELIESTLDEEKAKNSSRLDEQAMLLSQKFKSMHSIISRLKFHEINKSVLTEYPKTQPGRARPSVTMRGREGPMDLDTPRGYSPCWLDESPPKNEIIENKPKPVETVKPAPLADTSNANRTPVFSTFTALNHGSSGKGQARVRKSPFYTASPLGSNSKVYKNSFFRRLRSSFSDKDSEDDRAEDYGSKSTGWRKKNASRNFFKTGQHTQYGGNHLFLPFVLMGYLQVLFNGIVIAGILYFLMQVALTIRRDVDLKVDEQLSNIMSEIAHCSKQYIENRCSPELRVPAMEKACMAWEACMKKDPSTIGRAKLSAETFAEVINSLVDPISYKTMMFILLGIFGTMFISNYAFNAARSRGSGSAQKIGLQHDLAASGIMTPVSPFARKAFTSRSLQNVKPSQREKSM